MLSVNSPTINVDTGEQLKCSDKFTEIAKDAAMEMLTDAESRVRIAAGLMFCDNVHIYIIYIVLLEEKLIYSSLSYYIVRYHNTPTARHNFLSIFFVNLIYISIYNDIIYCIQNHAHLISISIYI